jgi:hypothetical protein
MGSEVVKTTYSSEDARRLKGLADLSTFVMKDRISKSGLNILKSTKTLADGSTIKSMAVNGTVITEVYTPVVELKKIVEKKEVIEGGGDYILLSSAKNKCYLILFNTKTCSIGGAVAKQPIVATFFADTYVDPDYDKRDEVCPYVWTVDGKDLIVVVSGGNFFQNVSGKVRNDWHNNNVVNYQDYNMRQRPQTYYYSCTQRFVNAEVRIAFSFSPLTYQAGLPYICRFIDHTKRLYTPILGRGEAFEKKYPKYSKCEDSPYGKKPFTVTKDGVSTYREVVKVERVIPLADPLNFNLFCYWPFVPYIHEISYLNLQWLSMSFLGGLPQISSLQEINSFQSYKMSHAEGSASLRTDVATGNFPEVNATSSNTNNFVLGESSGSSLSTSRQNQTKTFNVKKSATVGTVGNLKDLFVETELNGAWSYTYSWESGVTRSSNFPFIFYTPEFVDTLFWGDGTWTDSTVGHAKLRARYTNSIEGTQILKCGDVVVESGALSMRYEGNNNDDATHSGNTTHTRITTITHIPFDPVIYPGWETWTPQWPTRNNILHGMYSTLAATLDAGDAIDTGYPSNWSPFDGGGRGCFYKFQNTGAPYTDHYWFYEPEYDPTYYEVEELEISWVSDGTRVDNNTRESVATRSIVCFEVLDYDSLTYTKVESDYKHIIALLYKKVTVSHAQNRKYVLSHSNPDAGNFKDTGLPTPPLTFLDHVPATDKYNYTGTRNVNYLLCLLIGSVKTIIDLGTVSIGVSGHFNQSGTDKELKEMGSDLDAAQQTYHEDSVGPIFTVSGQRLYGVSVQCNKDSVVYSYDLEDMTGNPSNNVLLQYDSPANVEDYNQFWTKKKRVVGAVSYDGKHTTKKEFDLTTKPGSMFPDEVLAVGVLLSDNVGAGTSGEGGADQGICFIDETDPNCPVCTYDKGV